MTRQSRETHNIVIVGGNHAGVTLAHYLLREVLPSLNAGSDRDTPAFKVTLVSPSDHTFYKVVAPRVAVSSENIHIDTPFASIIDGFSNYDQSLFSFVRGEAVHLDERSKTVTVKPTEGANGTPPAALVQYDSLVIATGTKSASPLWTLHGDYKHTKAAFEDLQRRLPQAESVLIAGGGPTGVETVGEIMHHYKPKDITILSGTTRLLPTLNNTGVSAEAAKKLQSLGVKVIHNTRVTSSTALPDGRTSLELDDGSTKTVDVYINTTGGKPNTGFLPPSWLDDKKKIAVDATTLRATKAPAGVYGIGDVASYSRGGLMDTKLPIPALGYSIWHDLRESAPAGVTPLKQKTYSQITKDMQIVPIGPGGGVGSLFDWRIPSWMVWLIKSRTFFVEKAPQLAAGGEL
ncbi:hypothetical protein VTO42DRAFT_3047 [Malbranchea cinnamomea]